MILNSGGCFFVFPLPRLVRGSGKTAFLVTFPENPENESDNKQKNVQARQAKALTSMPPMIKAWAVEGFIYALIYLKEDLFER